MLKLRLLTVIVLVPPLLAALFVLPPAGVIPLFGIFVAAAAWEWAGLASLAGRARWGYVALVLAAGAVLIVSALASRAVSHLVLGAASVWWVAALFALRADAGIYHTVRGRLAAGLLTLVPAWVAVSVLHAGDARRPALILFVLLLVAAADSAAYAAGHAFGRHKLAPTISPGKTIEGVVGGVLAVVLLAGIYGTMVWQFAPSTLGAWVVLAATAGLVSVIGDLSESKLKRVAGVKDSGRLLPGHGGVLDRIDALTAAAPVFAWGWLLFFDARA